jgi:hypothetical protein
MSQESEERAERHGSPDVDPSPTHGEPAGFPAGRADGQACGACRELAGQAYLLARPHPRLIPVSDPLARRSYCCGDCGSEMGQDTPMGALPSWVIRTPPDREM